MDLSLLQTLKEKMQTETDFQKIWEYFLDHFGENPAFFDVGGPTSSPFLETVLESIGKELVNKDAKLENVLFVRLPEHGFIHGASMMAGRLLNVLYFEEIDRGVACMIQPGTNMTHIARFTAQKIERSWEPSVN